MATAESSTYSFPKKVEEGEAVFIDLLGEVSSHRGL